MRDKLSVKSLRTCSVPTVPELNVASCVADSLTVPYQPQRRTAAPDVQAEPRRGSSVRHRPWSRSKEPQRRPRLRQTLRPRPLWAPFLRLTDSFPGWPSQQLLLFGSCLWEKGSACAVRRPWLFNLALLTVNAASWTSREMPWGLWGEGRERSHNNIQHPCKTTI